jgi:hypothetical protein
MGVSTYWYTGVLEKRSNGVGIATNLQDTTAEKLLERLSDLENHPDEEGVVPYREFNVDGKLYYFTPGGFLYRKDPGTEEVGGFLCGYLTDEVWHYRVDDG